MGRQFLLTCIGVLFILGVQAQTFNIQGRIREAESKAAIQGATVILQQKRDTTNSETTFTDSAGRYQFTAVARDSFNLIVSSVGFETLQRTVVVDSANVDMDVVSLPRTSKELTGVTVTIKTPPAVQKGDTVQLNAAQYKVNPDATGEDLVRKMPGITVENGQVKAQGEVVQKVTLDGRELFGDDATAALRNLPAEVIDKVQVFDRLSDQSQFTGFDDGNSQKGINIVTKTAMRNGQFGRVFAGYGTDARYQAGGNATFLKDKRRISLVGNFNNTNQQNFSQQDLLGVTSTGNQRGGGQGGNRQRSGGGGSGGSQRGQGENFSGGFGNNANFLVGQQNGINKTAAAGINYSDVWSPKITVTGSYFFNNTNNTTDELANTHYFLKGIPNNTQQTASNSRNTNNRVNVRFEYKLDSFNQLIITPNLSFQNNATDRFTSTASFNNLSDSVRQTANTTNSTRAGNNLNNTFLFRHQFRKRGRTFSINLNTSFNHRDGETYVQTFERLYNTGGNSDTTTQRFTDQTNSGHQISTNLVYTEPLGQRSQLQFNYNPTFSKSNSDQQTFGMNPADNKYSLFLDSLSNKFENSTTAQNAGISYRYGTRDRQLSFGANYQQTDLHSDQTFPRTLVVDKTFRNVLPNAMFRYKVSARSTLRIMYRTNTNQPSVTQLANVVDVTNAPFFTAGNPELAQQYTHTLSGQYTFNNVGKALLLVANVYAQKASNYIANATFVPTKDSLIGNNVLIGTGQQLSIPINLDGYTNLRSFVTFAVPVKFIKSNLNLNGGVTYARLPGIINNMQSLSKNYTYTLGSVVGSNITQYVDFTLSYTANFNRVRSNNNAAINDDYFNHVASVGMNLLSKKGWFLQSDLNNQLYSGLTEGYNQSYFIWNMSAGKKFLKAQKGELRLSVFDLLKQNRSITRSVTETYIQDVQNQVLRQYFMLTFTYNLRNFGTAAARALNGNPGNSRGGGMRF